MEERCSVWVDDLVDELVPSPDSTIHGHADSIIMVALFADARYALAQGLREVEDATGDPYGYQDFFAVDGLDERVRLYGVTPGKGTGKRGSAIDVYLDQLRDLSEMRLDEAFTVAHEELEDGGYDDPGTMLRDIAEKGVVGAASHEVKPGMYSPRINEELRQEFYSLGGRSREEMARDIMGIALDGD